MDFIDYRTQLYIPPFQKKSLGVLNAARLYREAFRLAPPIDHSIFFLFYSGCVAKVGIRCSLE